MEHRPSPPNRRSAGWRALVALSAIAALGPLRPAASAAEICPAIPAPEPEPGRAPLTIGFTTVLPDAGNGMRQDGTNPLLRKLRLPSGDRPPLHTFAWYPPTGGRCRT